MGNVIFGPSDTESREVALSCASTTPPASKIPSNGIAIVIFADMELLEWISLHVRVRIGLHALERICRGRLIRVGTCLYERRGGFLPLDALRDALRNAVYISQIISAPRAQNHPDQNPDADFYDIHMKKLD